MFKAKLIISFLKSRLIQRKHIFFHSIHLQSRLIHNHLLFKNNNKCEYLAIVIRDRDYYWDSIVCSSFINYYLLNLAWSMYGLSWCIFLVIYILLVPIFNLISVTFIICLKHQWIYLIVFIFSCQFYNL